MTRPHRAGALSDDARLMSVCRVHRPKSRTERPRKTKIGTEVGHVTRDSDTTFKVKTSKVNLQGAGAYCGGLQLVLINYFTAIAIRITYLLTYTTYINSVVFHNTNITITLNPVARYLAARHWTVVAAPVPHPARLPSTDQTVRCDN